MNQQEVRIKRNLFGTSRKLVHILENYALKRKKLKLKLKTSNTIYSKIWPKKGLRPDWHI